MRIIPIVILLFSTKFLLAQSNPKLDTLTIHAANVNDSIVIVRESIELFLDKNNLLDIKNFYRIRILYCVEGKDINIEKVWLLESTLSETNQLKIENFIANNYNTKARLSYKKFSCFIH